MTQNDYLNKLLGLCTDNQKNLFNRMYPDGPSPKRLKWAITQVENTLKNLNSSKEELKYLKKEHEEKIAELTGLHSDALRKIGRLEGELKGLQELNERLSNPVSIKNSDVQERLILLDALEAGGVDNWNGYEAAITNYET